MSDPNWRQQPEIMEARRVCRALGKTAVMVIWIDEATGQFGGASYGTNGARCNAVARVLDEAMEAVVEPIDRLLKRAHAWPAEQRRLV